MYDKNKTSMKYEENRETIDEFALLRKNIDNNHKLNITARKKTE